MEKELADDAFRRVYPLYRDQCSIVWVVLKWVRREQSLRSFWMACVQGQPSLVVFARRGLPRSSSRALPALATLAHLENRRTCPHTQTPQETRQGFRRNPLCDSEHSGRRLSCASTYSKVARLCLRVNGANVNVHVFWNPPSLRRSGLHVQPSEAQGPLRRTDSLLLMVSWCPTRARQKWKFPAALPT